MKMKLMIGQPHVLPAKIETNFQTLAAMVETALKEDASMLILPLDAINGPGLGALINQLDFRKDTANARFRLERAGGKLQIIYSDNYNFCGFTLRPKCVGISPLGKRIIINGGGSAAYDHKGNLIARGKLFQQDIISLDFDSENLTLSGEIAEAFPSEIATIYHALIYSIREFCSTNHITHVVTGVSGGIDSAVATALYVLALGTDMVTTVSMPGRYNSQLTQKLALNLAANMKTHHITIPIQEGTDQICHLLQEQQLSVSTLTLENIQARERGARILAAVAATQNGIVSCNSNKAELTIGYSTFYGDMTGALAPLGDLWKYQVYELGRYINQYVFKKAIIPEAVFQIRPSAELNEEQTVGKGGDPLYYPYHDYLFRAFVKNISLSKIAQWYKDGTLEQNLGCHQNIIRVLFKNDNEKFFQDLEKWYCAFHGLAVAKRIQAPPVIVVSDHPLGEEEAQIGAYFPKSYLALKDEILKGTV